MGGREGVAGGLGDRVGGGGGRVEGEEREEEREERQVEEEVGVPEARQRDDQPEAEVVGVALFEAAQTCEPRVGVQKGRGAHLLTRSLRVMPWSVQRDSQR